MPEINTDDTPFDIELLEPLSALCVKHDMPIPIAKWDTNAAQQLWVEVSVGPMVREMRPVRAPGGEAEWNEALSHAIRHASEIIEYLHADPLLCRDQRCRMFGRRHEDTPHQTPNDQPHVRWWTGEHPDDKKVAVPVFEWRAVVEVDGIFSDINSDWEPWEGTEDDPEVIQELVNGNHGDSLGYEAAASAAGFSYGIQVRRIGETS